MSQSNHRDEPADHDLQFETAEPLQADEGSDTVCAACQRPIDSQYFALQDQVICPTCAANLNPPVTGTRVSRLAKATLVGVAAGLVGALIWFVIRRVAHIEIGLVAILVGYLVGKGVLYGSGNRGGRRYQVLAVVITYACIAANYVPDIVEAFVSEIREERANDPDAQAAADDAEPVSTVDMIKAIAIVSALVFGVALAAPFLGGAQSVMGLVIIGIALWQAWALAKRRVLPLSGPYQIGNDGPGSPREQLA